MNSRPLFPFRRGFAQRGVSLIELMIGMALGLIVVVGIGYIYMGSRQSYRVQDNMSRVQENGRYAVDILGRDIRMAGFMGCANLSVISLRTIADPSPNFSAGAALVGYDNGTGWTNPSSITRVSGTDVVMIQKAASTGINVTEKMGVTNANIKIGDNTLGFQAGQALFVTDCTAADLFRATNISGGSGNVTIAHGNNSNSDPNMSCVKGGPSCDVNLSKTYGTDAEVLAFESLTYFIGTNPAGRPALYRIPITGTAVELVDNVESMQLTFGVDSDGNGTVNQYVAPSAVTDWAKVLTARVSLLMVSPEDSVTDAPQKYVYNGSTVTPADRRLRFIFTSTIGVRNRLL